jgi:hypothetical protein
VQARSIGEVLVDATVAIVVSVSSFSYYDCGTDQMPHLSGRFE